MRQLVGIGRCESITVAINGVSHVQKFDHRVWLAWSGESDTGTLVGVFIAGKGKKISLDALDNEVVAKHREFHDAEPRGGVRGIAAGGRSTKVGPVLSLRYAVPSAMPSNKAGVTWNHKMGDFGRGGGGDQSDDHTLRPMLWYDARGLPIFVRRKGNKYTLADWLIG